MTAFWSKSFEQNKNWGPPNDALFIAEFRKENFQCCDGALS